MKTINGIEAGRGIAAVMVVFFHIARMFDLPFGQITEIGHVGVDFFFVLSGFIIYFIHAKDVGKPTVLLPFVIKRVVRVFPLFWLVFVVHALLAPFMASVDLPSISSGLSQFLLLPIVPDFRLVGVSWTLQFEMLFYAAFATLILHRLVGMLLMAAWLVAAVYWHFIMDMPANTMLLSSYVFQFFIGMLAGYVILTTDRGYGRSAAIIGAAGLCGLFYIELEGGALLSLDVMRICYGMAFGLIVIGLVGIENRYAYHTPKLMRTLGSASYAIYLGHIIISTILYKVVKLSGVLAFIPMWAAALGVISLTLYLCIELSERVETPMTNGIRRYMLTRFAPKP
jgi:exopolysaccharide production protein ExoZ